MCKLTGSAMGFLPGRGGGGACHMVLFPSWGSSAMGFLPGEDLPYGIPAGVPDVWYNFRGGGGGGVRGEEFPCYTGVLLGGNACLGMHDNVYFIHRFWRNKR